MTRYRALVPLYYRTDPAVIRRVKAGEKVPFAESKIRTCKAGALVNDLPRESVAGLLRKKWIEAVEEPPADGGDRGNS